MIVIDGAPLVTAPEVDVNQSTGGRRFGFAVGCRPSCTRARTTDGAEYYSHIDGKPILGEDGTVRFVRGTRAETMSVTVVRDRAPIGFVLTAR